jgi:hypothetical protein
MVTSVLDLLDVESELTLASLKHGGAKLTATEIETAVMRGVVKIENLEKTHLIGGVAYLFPDRFVFKGAGYEPIATSVNWKRFEPFEISVSG